MNMKQAIDTLRLYGHASFTAGTWASDRAIEAKQWLEQQGHSVLLRDRPQSLGSDGPSTMVYIDGKQVV